MVLDYKVIKFNPKEGGKVKKIIHLSMVIFICICSTGCNSPIDGGGPNGNGSDPDETLIGYGLVSYGMTKAGVRDLMGDPDYSDNDNWFYIDTIQDNNRD